MAKVTYEHLTPDQVAEYERLGRDAHASGDDRPIVSTDPLLNHFWSDTQREKQDAADRGYFGRETEFARK